MCCAGRGFVHLLVGLVDQLGPSSLQRHPLGRDGLAVRLDRRQRLRDGRRAPALPGLVQPLPGRLQQPVPVAHQVLPRRPHVLRVACAPPGAQSQVTPAPHKTALSAYVECESRGESAPPNFSQAWSTRAKSLNSQGQTHVSAYSRGRDFP